MKLPNFGYEKRVWKAGYKLVAGCDEVGRGALAGPVVAGCVVFSKSYDQLLQIHRCICSSTARKQVSIQTHTGNRNAVIINDSKKLSPKQRELANFWIKKNCLTYGIGKVSASEIDRIGIVPATEKAFRKAIVSAKKKLGKNIDYLLVDAFYIPYVTGVPMARKRFRKGKLSQGIEDRRSQQKAIINGDEKSFSIACASIIAKVYRDKFMTGLSKMSKYKKYKWDENKGYGTKNHRSAIKKYGVSNLHRKMFCKN